MIKMLILASNELRARSHTPLRDHMNEWKQNTQTMTTPNDEL